MASSNHITHPRKGSTRLALFCDAVVFPSCLVEHTIKAVCVQSQQYQSAISIRYNIFDYPKCSTIDYWNSFGVSEKTTTA